MRKSLLVHAGAAAGAEIIDGAHLETVRADTLLGVVDLLNLHPLAVGDQSFGRSHTVLDAFVLLVSDGDGDGEFVVIHFVVLLVVCCVFDLIGHVIN